MKIPERGMNPENVMAEVERRRHADLDWRSGRTFGFVYDAGREAEALAKRAYVAYLSENALDPTSFPSLLRFENEIVSMAREHLGGDEEVVGNFTSGGTESILLAVKTARDLYRATRPEIRQPEMVLPVTAHAAFHKAAEYFDVKAVPVPVGEDFRADVAAMREAVGPNTILLVGSAPSYAHGVIDPIVDIGALALEHGLLFHVDACVGGFMLPYFRRLGEPVPDFDFRVPGVTSMSMDLHKYGFAPKGASIVLQKDRGQRKHQIFACSSWPGYSVVNATVQSSKTGGPLAAAWAVLHFFGDEGYLELARTLRDTTKRIAEGIDAMEGLYVLGRPEMCMLAMASDTVDVFHVVDEMQIRGWYVQAQLGFDGSPPNFHLSVGPTNAPHVEALLSDLAASVEAAKAFGPSEVAQMVKSTFAAMSPTDISPEVFTSMLSMAGVEGTDLPERRADINSVLDALPRPVCDRLLVEFVNELFTESALPKEGQPKEGQPKEG